MRRCRCVCALVVRRLLCAGCKLQATIVVLALACGLARNALGQESSQCTVTAALFMPLSGPAATVGDDFRMAAELSYSRLAADIRKRLTLVYEDTRMTASVAVSAHRSLVNRVKPDVLLVSFAESVEALAPIAQSSRTPLIGCAPTRGFLKGRPFVFRHWTDAESMSPHLFEELKRRGLRRLGVVYSEHPAMQEFEHYFRTYGEARGLEFVMASSVLPTDTDLRGVAIQIASKRPDAVVYFLLPPQPSIFTKQYRLLDPKTPFFAFINTESEHELRAAQGAMEGVVYVGPVFSPSFISDFSAHYHGNYPEICSGNFYDMVQMLGAAVADNRCSGESLRQFIGGLTSFTGVAGTYGIDGSREFRLPVELRTVRGGRFVQYP